MTWKAYALAAGFSVVSGYMFWKPLLEEQAVVGAISSEGRVVDDVGSIEDFSSSAQSGQVKVNEKPIESDRNVLYRLWDRIGPHTV